MGRILEMSGVGRWPFSIRAKLVLWIVVIWVVTQLTLSVVLLLFQRATIASFFDARVQARADAVLADLRAADFRVTDDDLREITKEHGRLPLRDPFFAGLYTSEGEAIASVLRPAPPLELATLPSARGHPEPLIRRQPFPALMTDGAKARVHVQRVEALGSRSFVVQVAVGDRHYESMMGTVVMVLVCALPVGGVAAWIAARMIAALATSTFERLRLIAGSFAPEEIEREMDLGRTPTEFSALERDLQAVRTKLRLALHAQERFISNVSHELKTPIAVLLTEAQTLDPKLLPPDGRKFVQSVSEEMHRLARMTESFLTLTRIRGGATLASARPNDINDVVMEAVIDSNKMAAQYGITLAPMLAASDEPLLVAGEAELLRVMLDNLIRNAVRFSPKGREVIVSVGGGNGECGITVRDFGKGVPEELIDRLFDRFTQAAEESLNGRGFGLGLSIAQGIAELHGGKISVRNLSEGCEFTVRLPTIAPDPASNGRWAVGAE